MALSFLFGKPKGNTAAAPAPGPARSAAPDLTESIGNLNAHLSDLEKTQDMWMKREAAYLQKAKQFNAKGDKKSALQWLRRKKTAESQVTKAMSMMETAEAQVIAMQCMATNAEHLKAIDAGLQAMKRMRDHINPEKVEEVAADMDEMMSDVREMEDVLGRGLARPQYDEDELAAELEALGAEEGPIGATAAATAAPAPAPVHIPTLPEVPTGDIHIPGVAATTGPARVAIAVGGAGGGGGGLSDLEALDAAM